MFKKLALYFLAKVGTVAPLGSWINKLFIDYSLKELSEYKEKYALQALRGTVGLLAYTAEGSEQRTSLIEKALDISKKSSKHDLESTFIAVDTIHFFSPPTTEIATKVDNEFVRLKDLLYKEGPKRQTKKISPSCLWKHEIC